MAKDITVAVTGQNPDGTLNIRQMGGDNPFMQSSQAMTPYNPGTAQPASTAGYKARIGNVEVNFASEADFLKADRELREMMPGTGGNVPMVGGPRGGFGGGGGGMQTWLRTGADAANAIGGFLAARGIQRKIDDVNNSLDDQRAAMNELEQLTASGKYNDLIPILRRIFQAERDATEAHVSALDDEITALDVQTGAGVAGVVSNFVQGSNGPSFGGGGDGAGIGTALAVGGAGLGLGLLMSRNNNNDSGRRRRR